MIIDFHTHVFSPFFQEKRAECIARDSAFKTLYESPRAKLVGAEDLLRSMDENEVQRSVIFGFPWKDEEFYARHNDYILESAARRPDRLTGFCCFSPLGRNIAKETERCLKQGLKGVGELAVYGSGITGAVVENLKSVMNLCVQYNALFMLHTNEPVGHAYPGKTPNTLLEIYDFVKAYPSNRIILAHWGGGLLFYALMKKEVRKTLENVWFDTAASPYLYSPDIYRIAGEIIGFEKILFGSDYPLLGPARYVQEMDTDGLTANQQKLILGLNAQNLLNSYPPMADISPV